MERVTENDEEANDSDNEYFAAIADPKPKDRHRNPRDWRNWPKHVQNGTDNLSQDWDSCHRNAEWSSDDKCGRPAADSAAETCANIAPEFTAAHRVDQRENYFWRR